jgi:hypothetical protein
MFATLSALAVEDKVVIGALTIITGIAGMTVLKKLNQLNRYANCNARFHLNTALDPPGTSRPTVMVEREMAARWCTWCIRRDGMRS